MHELRRHMGFFQTTIYGIGLILGAGIYVLIGEAAGMAGDAVWISYFLLSNLRTKFFKICNKK